MTCPDCERYKQSASMWRNKAYELNGTPLPWKPRIDQGPDYERGFVDGMQYQMQSSVDKAVNRMAQPEQCKKEQRVNGEYVCNCKPGKCSELAQPEQEPVAWMEGESVYWHTNQSLNDWIRANGTPLYATPPKREWVGLTDEEIKYIEEDFSNEFGLEAKHSVDFAQAIEAKLKEKNT